MDLINPRGSLRNPKATADGPDEMRISKIKLTRRSDWLNLCVWRRRYDKEEPDVRNHTQEELDTVCDEAHALHAYTNSLFYTRCA